MTTETENASREFLTVRELAELLRIKERKVYDLAASGEVPCVKVTGKLLFPEAAVRVWIALGSSGNGRLGPRPAVFLGSHDPLLDWALRQSRSGLATFFDGSLDGIARFCAREGVATGLHVHDARSGAWNVDSVAAGCADENAVLVAWATRTRGLVFREADVAGVNGVADLAGRRVVPRQPASGAQQLLEHFLAKADMPMDALILTPAARSESDAVLAIAQGSAEVAFGLEALARPYNLGFVPIVEERFDLLVDRRAWFEPPMRKLFDFTATPEFRSHAAGLSGYDVSALGAVRWNA